MQTREKKKLVVSAMVGLIALAVEEGERKIQKKVKNESMENTKKNFKILR